MRSIVSQFIANLDIKQSVANFFKVITFDDQSIKVQRIQILIEYRVYYGITRMSFDSLKEQINIQWIPRFKTSLVSLCANFQKFIITDKTICFAITKNVFD